MNHTITFYHKGVRYTDDFPGEEKELRQRFTKEKKTIISMAASRKLGKKVDDEEIVAVLTALSDMIKSGAPLSKALNAILLSTPKGRMKNILTGLLNQVTEGKDLSMAMNAYRDVFGHTVMSMIAAGESTGRLGAAMESAAGYVRTMSGTKRELISKLMYPGFLMLMGIVTLMGNTLYTIPKIMNSDLFKMTKVDKDNIYTNALNVIAVAVPITITVLIVVGILLLVYYKTNQLDAERHMLKVPAIRSLVFNRGYYVAFYSLAELVASGVRLDSALEIARAAVTSKTLQQEFDVSIKALREGESFSAGFTSLTPIEKTMLEISANQEKTEMNLRLVANRYYEQMIKEIKKIAPRVYAITMFLVVTIFFLMLLGIFVPYGKILSGIRM